MSARSRKCLWIVLLLLFSAAWLVFLFRYDILFQFQLMRLQQLGCNQSARAAGIAASGNCSKFWVHRTDSYERLKQLSPYFTGLEADLVFDKERRKFRVYHPPVSPGNLFADTYFQFIRTSGDQLWLDIKNIEPSSFDEAIGCFQQADSLYHIRKQVIIESSELVFANRLAKLGFTVSYMVSSAQLDRREDMHLVSASLSPEVKFVSQEDIYADALKAAFPDKKIITWAISFKNYFDLSHFKALLADSAIEVVLINIKSRGYR